MGHLFAPTITQSNSSSSSDLGAEQQVGLNLPFLTPDGGLDSSHQGTKRVRGIEEGYADDEGGDQVGDDLWREPAKPGADPKLKLLVLKLIAHLREY